MASDLTSAPLHTLGSPTTVDALVILELVALELGQLA
jgi:hypothetical protein